ncbi:MAG: alpha/beta hydrolase [Deltaproteobacteria bacterium]|nr:alpha/beta hydrolase [Deltaproteobacteria bacterium]
MPTIVLVHGAFADHHAWDAARPLLEARGYRVVAPDLPGHGDDHTPVVGITLDSYVAAIDAVVTAERAPVVLVGHSMAGMVVTGVAERHPERVARLVLVGAYLPADGDSLEALARTDTDSLVGANMVFAPDYSTVSIKPEALPEAICADVPAEIQGTIVAGQKPEPLAPFQGVAHLTAGNFGRVRLDYLSTTKDRAVTPALQRRMIAAHGHVATVVELPTSHLPFVAAPQAFVDALVALIAG